MGLSRHFRSVTGNVGTPGPKDPVDVSRQGNTTSMEFDFGAQEAFGQLPAPVTQSERGAEALLKAMGRIPDMPRDLMRMNSQQRQKIGYEPSMSIGDLRMMDEQAMSAKPPENYGRNNGGTGNAGRGTQFGKSQFDVAQQFMDKPEQIDDKPWELDDNTNADVQSGVSLTPKPEENVVDKEPDLQTPQGLYQALAKKYPDILTQNLDQLQKSRVTEEELEGLSDRSGLGSLFIAASKAASGAGSIGGKTAESIAPTIVNREDTLARQRLKDRMDVASENMQMNAKAVDLAMKQIDFADEREQYDPNSDVSQFARDFMKQEFDVNVPNNVPAYQLKQFLPAVVQKYQAQERASYQSALLGQRTAESLLNDAYKRYQTAIQSGDKQKQIEAQKEIARLREMAKAEPKQPKPEKTLGGVEKSVADAEFKIADKFNNEPSVKKFKQGNIALQEMQGLAKEESTYGDQGLINGYAKILDPESVVREGEYAVVERGGGILNTISNRLDVLRDKGRLQPSQRQKLLKAAEALQNGRRSEYQRIRKGYEERAQQYGLDPVRALGTEETPEPAAGEAPATLPSGKPRLTEADRARMEQLKKAKGGK